MLFGKKREHYRLWEKGKEQELAYWRNVIMTKGLPWPDAFKMRLDPDKQLQPEIVENIDVPPGGTAKILDVGAGPLTWLGKKWPGRNIIITAVDPLAEGYNTILGEFGIVPPVKVQFGEAEKLNNYFPPNYFDFVYSCNALDHAYDPVAAIRQIILVLKPGSRAILEHRPNEAVTENYQGLHQWNFCMEDGFFVIWSRYKRTNINKLLVNKARIISVRTGQVPTHVGGDWITAVLVKLP